MRRRSLRSGSALLAILLAGVSLLLAAPAASAEPGSTANDVATASSTTAVRCAFRTYNLPTDWYLPSPAAPPVGLLYAQHGFAESRADFSEFATAAAAAGFVVFVPTLPTADLFGCTVQNLGNNTRFLSNVASLFATAGDPLGALSTSYAAAVAKIGRPAPPLPTALTIIGHSAGGEAALYIAQQLTAPNHGTADLRGVVLADPVRHDAGVRPGGWPEMVYLRLHGSPRMYYSSYGKATLQALALKLRESADSGAAVWCIFDNTASGAAVANALELQGLLGS
jgi:acetyl esterase/lipase